MAEHCPDYMTGMNLDGYLRRIGYAGPRAATLATLREITRQHAMSIPFENLSVLLDGPPRLEVDALEDKLVARSRGGYCYEQNGLLAAALRALGFPVTGLSARVRYGVPPEVVTPRSHMLMRVDTADGPAFADAGFGGLTLTAPVLMRWHEEQDTPHERVRLVPAGSDFLLQALVGDTWMDVYRFDLAVQLPPDYVQQNWHTATRPDALFANNLIIAMPMPKGRYALFNRTLTWRPLSGEVVRTEVGAKTELRELLAELFSIEPSQAELDRAWEVAGRHSNLHPGFS
jgi:N-hydroxyarylamine O-acetyltransferase